MGEGHVYVFLKCTLLLIQKLAFVKTIRTSATFIPTTGEIETSKGSSRFLYAGSPPYKETESTPPVPDVDGVTYVKFYVPG